MMNKIYTGSEAGNCARLPNQVYFLQDSTVMKSVVKTLSHSVSVYMHWDGGSFSPHT